MSADMKTLRAALAVVANGFTTHRKTLAALIAALDELEVLRGQDGVAEEALRQRDVAMAQRDELLAALRRLYDEGEGCAACGKATRPGCGCRYEQAAQALRKAGGQ